MATAHVFGLSRPVDRLEFRSTRAWREWTATGSLAFLGLPGMPTTGYQGLLGGAKKSRKLCNKSVDLIVAI